VQQLLNYINVSSTTIERFIIIIYVQRIQRASGEMRITFVKFNIPYHILMSALTVSEVYAMRCYTVQNVPLCSDEINTSIFLIKMTAVRI